MTDNGITVQIKGNKYRVNGYQWFAVDGKPLVTKATVKVLNNLCDPLGPSGADPDPDLTLAMDAQKKFGARILKRDGPKPSDNFDPDQVY